jgi:hypothetical protein
VLKASGLQKSCGGSTDAASLRIWGSGVRISSGAPSIFARIQRHIVQTLRLAEVNEQRWQPLGNRHSGFGAYVGRSTSIIPEQLPRFNLKRFFDPRLSLASAH